MWLDSRPPQAICIVSFNNLCSFYANHVIHLFQYKFTTFSYPDHPQYTAISFLSLPLKLNTSHRYARVGFQLSLSSASFCLESIRERILLVPKVVALWYKNCAHEDNEGDERHDHTPTTCMEGDGDHDDHYGSCNYSPPA
ncbi:hypothetical protein SLA2020_038460 [Shorea laevis]